MEAYSIDLRERVIADSQEGLCTSELAKKYRVSESWVRLLKRRYRESGQIAPRQQRVHHETKLDGHLEQLQVLLEEKPDATLAELRDQLGANVSVSSVWRALRRLQVTFKKKSSMPPSRIARMFKRSVPNGKPR
jgi:transposase